MDPTFFAESEQKNYVTFSTDFGRPEIRMRFDGDDDHILSNIILFQHIKEQFDNALHRFEINPAIIYDSFFLCSQLTYTYNIRHHVNVFINATSMLSPDITKNSSVGEYLFILVSCASLLHDVIRLDKNVEYLDKFLEKYDFKDDIKWIIKNICPQTIENCHNNKIVQFARDIVYNADKNTNDHQN
ncbi:MAG: HD superfamily hydrolase [Satyrvirus sp.]|uniref:HD superfamily hydrolase n=1 Tax=Satyrvirus sp. TaxID=2487771 RepID=A0A3G5AEK2_9VIRU|nr:MAG: HD superfamily hydrolase [Satyrvirus sp.]